MNQLACSTAPCWYTPSVPLLCAVRATAVRASQGTRVQSACYKIPLLMIGPCYRTRCDNIYPGAEIDKIDFNHALLALLKAPGAETIPLLGAPARTMTAVRLI